MRPLLISLGDANGLGPELVVRHFRRHPPGEPVVAIGPEAALAGAAARLRIGRCWSHLAPDADLGRLPPGLHVLTPPEVVDVPLAPGRATPQGGRAAGVALELAARLMAKGQGRALVTCPLHKAMLQAAGFDFPGHTEFLAQRAGLGADDICMHLCGPRLRVSLVTTHPPLVRVPDLVTIPRVRRCLELTAAFLIRLGLPQGRIAVCGLNPHAGESGTIGQEEVTVIGPAVAAAQAAGIPCVGPLPADTVFFRAARGEFAAVLAMYHDQGLAPLKLLDFGQAVNVTLGLPYVRTSPDHGTGFDLVGTGGADLGGFAAAVALALRLTPEHHG